MKNIRAFTMLELIVIMVIVGIMAAMAVPNYLRAQQRGIERSIADNLDVIWQAVRSYQINNGAFPPTLANLTAINTTLALYIIDDGSATYNCALTPPVTGRYDCFGTPTSGGWVLHVRERHYGERAVRSSGTAPTCSPQCPWITYSYTGDI
jgi:type II secretory pathway pseudopilin PulG